MTNKHRLIGGLDLETTGLDTQNDRIIEIAVSIFDYDTERRVGGFCLQFNPRKAISQKAQEVHGISLRDLVDCGVFEDSAMRIHTVLSNCKVLVAHNGIGFDFPLLDAEFKRAGLRLPRATLFDTMLEGTWACEDGKYPRLKELAFALGFEYDEDQAHGATYDTDLMMRCFFEAKRRYGLFAIDFGEDSASED